MKKLVGVWWGVVGLGLLCIWQLWKALWARPRKIEKLLRQQGFRGNSYRLLFGDIRESSSLIYRAQSKPISLSDDVVPRVIPFEHKNYLIYGKAAFTWMGPRAFVRIMDPEMIKQVLTKIHTFEKPKINPLGRLLVGGLVSYERDKWAKHRKIINQAFHLEKLKDMLPAFYTSCAEMISKWERMELTCGGSFELDVWPHLEILTSEVISRTAFGSSFEEGRRIFQLQREQAEHLIQISRSLYIPGWRFVPTKRNRRMMKIHREVIGLVKDIINKRIKAMEAGGESGSDLLGILLEQNAKQIQEDNNFGITIEEIVEECKLFYLAGQETTSVLLVWTLILLGMHTDWQERARQEVTHVFDTQYDKIAFEGLSRLKIVTMILYEVLRLYPPAVALTRTIREDMAVGELKLPAGVVIQLPIMLLHHSDEIWGDDVKEFKPDRFNEGISKVTRGQVTYFPFSWGPRICVGQTFAMLEAKMALSLILRRFSFKISPSYSHAPHSIITLRPQHGAPLILTPLS